MGVQAEAVDLAVNSVTSGVTDHECCFLNHGRGAGGGGRGDNYIVIKMVNRVLSDLG